MAEPPSSPSIDKQTLQSYADQLRDILENLSPGNAQSAKEKLEAIPKELRGWEFEYAMDRIAQTKINGDSSITPNGIGKAAPPKPKRTRGYLHPKGHQVVFACADGTLHVTDRLLKEKEFSVEDPWKESLTSVAFSQSGNFCVAGTMKGHMTIYQTEDWSVLSKVDPTKDELFIAAVESSKKEKESRADDDEFRKKLEEALENAGPRAAIANLAISPDGKRILFHRTKFAFLWDVSSEKCVAQLENVGFMEPGPLQFSSDGSIAYTAGLMPIHLYDAINGNQIKEFVHATQPLHLSLSADRRWMASGTRGNITRDFRIFDATTGKQVFSTGQQKEAITGIAFLGRSDRVAALEKAGRLRIYHAPTGVVMLEIQLQGASGQLQVSEDGNILLWTRLNGQVYETEYIEIKRTEEGTE